MLGLVLGSDEFVTLSVDVYDFYLVIITQVFAQFRDVNVHGASVEIVVINPYCLQREVALEYLVGVTAQQ